MFNCESPYIIILKRLGTIFLHFTRRSTIHGLNHLAQARSVKRRLFWLLISLSATVGFFVNLFYLVEKFIQTPVLTNTFHDFKNFTYPDVTFCLLNPINLPPIPTEEYKELIKHINIFTTAIQPAINSKIIKHINKTNNLPKIELTDYLFINENITYTHQPAAIIVACAYMAKECTWKHFRVHYIWPYGNCFTFDVTKMVNMSRNIMEKMKFNSYRPDFRIVVYKAINKVDKKIHDPFNDITKPTGLLVMIHEANTYPHISDSFIVDEYTQIDLKITTKSHLQSLKKCNPKPKNYTYCDIYRSDSCNTYEGKNVDCIYELIQTNLADYCKCQLHTMPIMSKHNHLPYCFSIILNDFNMVDSIRECFSKSLESIDQDAMHATCYQDLCDHPTFTTVVSHSKYPAIHDKQTHRLWLNKLSELEEYELKTYNISTLFEKAIKPNHSTIVKEKTFMDDDNTETFNNTAREFNTIKELAKANRDDLINEDFINRNFALLRIVPSSFFMDHIEETEEYPLSRLLSDIGGCVGLWVGASLITIFEFFDLLMDLSDVLRIRPKQKPGASSNNANGDNDANDDMNREDLIFGNIENMMMRMLDGTGGNNSGRGDNNCLEMSTNVGCSDHRHYKTHNSNNNNRYDITKDLILKNMSFEQDLLLNSPKHHPYINSNSSTQSPLSCSVSSGGSYTNDDGDQQHEQVGSIELIVCTADTDIITNV